MTDAELRRVAAEAAQQPAGTGRATPVEFRAARAVVQTIGAELARVQFRGKAGPVRRDALKFLLDLAYTTGRTVLEMAERHLAEHIGTGREAARNVLRDLCAAGFLTRYRAGCVYRDHTTGDVTTRGHLYALHKPRRGWWRQEGVCTWAIHLSQPDQESLRLIKGFIGTVVRDPVDGAVALWARGGIRNARPLFLALEKGEVFDGVPTIAARFCWPYSTAKRLVDRLVQLQLAAWDDSRQLQRGSARIEDVARQLGAVECAERRQRLFRDERERTVQKTEAYSSGRKLKLMEAPSADGARLLMLCFVGVPHADRVVACLLALHGQTQPGAAAHAA